MEGCQTNAILFKVNFLFNAMMFHDPKKNLFLIIVLFKLNTYGYSNGKCFLYNYNIIRVTLVFISHYKAGNETKLCH